MQTVCESDLLIIGGGPAGLSAAINGASEGLVVRILDGGSTLGGQAKESAAIENYPGFADGITGEDLAGQFIRQAIKFNTKIVSNVSAAMLSVTPEPRRFTVTTDDYSEYVGKAVLLSLGLSYRRLQADGLGPLMGRGVFYGRPPGLLAPNRKCEVAVVGGANSAGQAVVKLAKNPKVHIRMFIRKEITNQMSTYLIERIRGLPNVEICEGCEVIAAKGDRHLKQLIVKRAGAANATYDVDTMFIFIGATPRTLWLQTSTIKMDAGNYILTGEDVSPDNKMSFQTSLNGVFAAGDVRSGSIKRIAAAIGEGSGAIPMVHRYLATINGNGGSA